MNSAISHPMAHMGPAHCHFDALIGYKLKLIFAPVCTDDLPHSMLSLVDRRCATSRRQAQPEIIAAGWLASWTEARRHRANQRMLERAVRKQGISWLVDEPFDTD